MAKKDKFPGRKPDPIELSIRDELRAQMVLKYGDDNIVPVGTSRGWEKASKTKTSLKLRKQN